MADKQVLVEIKYDVKEAVQNVNDLTSAIEAERVEQGRLKSELESGKISQKEYSKGVENSKTISSKANSERKNTVKLLQSEKGSVEQLKAQIKDITTKRDKLNMSTADGKKKAGEYNNQLDQMKKSLKGAQTETGKTTGAVGQFGKNMMGLPGPIGGVIRGVVGMTKAMVAFILTPIGAVIAVIALGLKALMSYFKGSEEGQNALNKIMMVFKTIVGNLGDMVQKVGKIIFEAVSKPKETIIKLGELIKENLINRLNAFGVMGKAIIKIFSKDWKEGLKDLGNGFIQLNTGVTDFTGKIQNLAKKGKDAIAAMNEEMKKEIKISQNLADRQAALDKLQRNFIVERAKLEASSAELQVKAMDKANFSDKERLKYLEEAVKQENKILDTNYKITKEKFELKRVQNSLSNSTKEDLDEQAQLEADLYNVQKENSMKKKTLTSQISKIQVKLNKDTIAGSEEVSEADKKAQEDILKRHGEAIYKMAELEQMRMEKDAKTYEEEKELKQKRAEEELEFKLENKELLQEEIELLEAEHKERLLTIEEDYQAKIQEQREMELAKARGAMQDIIASTRGMADARVAILGDSFAKIATINYKEVKSASDAFLAIGSAARGLTNLIVAGHQNELNDLQVQKEAELALAGDNTDRKEAIEQKYNRKLIQLKKNQFKDEKKAAIIDASISTALAVVNGLTTQPFLPLGVAMAAVAGVLGGVQIASIARQQEPQFSAGSFAKGGIIGGKPHSQGGTKFYGTDGSMFEAEANEAMFVLKKDATAEIAAYSMLNEKHGGASFAKGGRAHLQEGGEAAGVNIEDTVYNILRDTPIVVRVADIETGMTDFNKVKKAGVI